jgi:aryl carrier-like protein
MPIGRGVANTRIEILGADGERAPVGTPGELCIGGVQLARGYLGRPALTADRFVPDPDGRGSRLYRSGDLARWLPGGEVEYLGRLDHQVKIRGFRIELGEIEAALAAEAEVRAAVVLARPDATGTPRLVGYIVYAPDASADGPALIERLRRRLPEHMLPTALVPLTELPLTRSGKVDRAALPDPDPRPGVGYRAPAAGAESAIAAVWEQVLGIEAVGADDDFFELGGDSIRSLKVVARLRAQGYGLSIADLFTEPTVRALAGVLELAEQEADPSPRSTAFGLINQADMALLRQQFGGDPQ